MYNMLIESFKTIGRENYIQIFPMTLWGSSGILVHISFHEGIKVVANKIKSMMEWSIEKILIKLIGFLWLMKYYCMLVKNYFEVTISLKSLSNKEAISLTREVTGPFQKHKKSMYTYLVLATINFSKIFVVECDASHHRIFIFLFKKEDPFIL